MRFWKRLRRNMAIRQHALTEVSVTGRAHLVAAQRMGGGVLITPNHPTHADPFALLEAADQLKTPMYFMAAWQVFHETHSVGRRVLRQHGCFSVNREGHDVQAIRQAIRILKNAQAPLVIFPEGEVFHLNDRVTPFRNGAVHSAVLAAERSGKPVSIVPCALKFQFLGDPRPVLRSRMDRLEAHLGCPALRGTPLKRRILKFGARLLEKYECQYFGGAQRGPLQLRINALMEAILQPLERRFGLTERDRPVPVRVKQLRFRIIRCLDEETPVHGIHLPRALQELFLVIQAYSYPVDYITEHPSVERLAETIEKLEEDVLRHQRATPAGPRRAVVEFGRAIVIRPETARSRPVAVRTADLQSRVQKIIDRMNGVLPPVKPATADEERLPTLAA